MWRNEKCIRDMNLYPTFIMSPGHNSIYSSEILFSIFNSSSSSVRLLVTQKQLLKSIFSSARHEICLSCQHRYSEIFSLTTKRLQTGMTTAATTQTSQDIFRKKRFNINAWKRRSTKKIADFVFNFTLWTCQQRSLHSYSEITGHNAFKSIAVSICDILEVGLWV